MVAETDQHLSIPIIDFAPLLTQNSQRETFAKAGKEIYEAFKNVGFAYIKNHSVPQEVVDEAFEWVCCTSIHFNLHRKC
jgi:isopenicillin N synthase-like dioxygenase